MNKLDASTLQRAFQTIQPFLSREQFASLRALCQGSEERAYFDGQVRDLACRIATLPKGREQELLGLQAVVHLHYFVGGSDWYITEQDELGGTEQAFGYAVLNGRLCDAELGYISIAELTRCGVELDLLFAPRTLSEVQAELKRRAS